jgi:hypothetical protein
MTLGIYISVALYNRCSDMTKPSAPNARQGCKATVEASWLPKHTDDTFLD